MVPCLTYIFRNLNPWTQTRMFPYGSAFIMFPYSISNHSPLKKINITISLHMYQIMLAYFHLTAYLKKGLKAHNNFFMSNTEFDS